MSLRRQPAGGLQGHGRVQEVVLQGRQPSILSGKTNHY
jgi:hypothetical protein